MECKKYQEQISAAVDQYLSPNEMHAFMEHIRTCRVCKYEFDIESLTKAVLKSKARMVRTPGVLMQRIVEKLSQERDAPVPVPRWWNTLLARPLVKPAIAFAVACTVVLFLVNIPKHSLISTSSTSNTSSNVIEQARANYGAVVNGQIKPQLASSTPEQVMSLFAGKTDFPVLVPTMKDCQLIGGVLNDYSGTVLAHVVYRHDAEIIYMYQTCWETVMKGEKLNLPSAVSDQLKQTGWFAQSSPDGRTVVLWAKGRTLCVAVSRMNQEDLVACLAAGTSPGSDPW